MSGIIFGAIIDHENGCTTTDTPHKKITMGRYTHYFAKLPAGDWMRHVHDSRDEHGYCGDTVEFLMEDGTTELVKGPYRCQGSLSHDSYDLESLIELTGMEELRTQATKITVGRKLLGLTDSGSEIVHEEKAMSIVPIPERLRPEWKGLDLKIAFRGCIKYGKVNDYLQVKSTEGV